MHYKIEVRVLINHMAQLLIYENVINAITLERETELMVQIEDLLSEWLLTEILTVSLSTGAARCF